MTDLFAATDYRDYLCKIVYAPETKRGYQALLAKAMGCQAAYLSQVLKGKSELTEDQALKAAVFLELSAVGIEYFVLLVRLARASTLALREYLEVRRAEIQREASEVRSRLKSDKPKLDEAKLVRYFSSSIPSTLHVATSSEKYRSVEALAKRFALPEPRVREILEFLEEIGLIEKVGGSWHYANAPLHFPRESPMNIVHQMSRRRQAMQAIEGNSPDNLHFSSVFTADLATVAEIKADLLDYIEKSHAKVHASGTSEVYSMSLDLFRSV